MREVNLCLGAIFAVCFRGDVEGSGLFHGGDFVIDTPGARRADVEVQTFGPGDDDGKQVRI